MFGDLRLATLTTLYCSYHLITAALALVEGDMLTRVWNEMDYRIDVCRITKGGQIEHL